MRTILRGWTRVRKLALTLNLPPKRVNGKDLRKQDSKISNENIYKAIQTVIKRFDEQGKRLSFELRVESNTQAAKDNKEEIGKIQRQIESLTKENSSLKEMCQENTRYKRRWYLRLLRIA